MEKEYKHYMKLRTSGVPRKEMNIYATIDCNNEYASDDLIDDIINIVNDEIDSWGF